MKLPSQISSYAVLLGNFDISFLISLLSTISWHMAGLQQFALAFEPLNICQRLYLWEILSQHQTHMPAGFLTVQHTVEGESRAVNGSGSQTLSTMPPLWLPCDSLQPRAYPTTGGVLRLVLELFHMQKSYSTELQPFIHKLFMKCDIDNKVCFKALLSTYACCVSFHSWGNVHEETSHHLLLVRIESVTNVHSRVLKISGTEKNNKTQ